MSVRKMEEKNIRKITRVGSPRQIISNKKDVLYLRFAIK